MITKTDKLEAEVISCVKQAYEDYPSQTSPPIEEVLEHLEKCFGAQKFYQAQQNIIEDMREAIKAAYNTLGNCIEFIQDAHIIEAQWYWEPVEQSEIARAKLKPFIQ